ncbi:glycosyltransferase family 39 protein [Acidobacteriota bacterium]
MKETSSPLDRRAYRAPLIAVLLVVFFGLACLSMRQKSITTDEVPHISAGYSYWKTASFRLNPEHPPLVKLLAGFPLLFLNPTFDTTASQWQQAEANPAMQYPIAHRFLFHTPENLAKHRALLFWSRMPTILLGLVLCWYVYILARFLYGTRAGLVSLTLIVFSPTVLAHTRLVTTDVAITAFWVAATYHMAKYLRSPTYTQLLGCGLATGLAMAAKFSGLFTLLIIGTVGFLCLFIPGSPWSPAGKGKWADDIKSRFGRYALSMAILVAIAASVVCLSYFVISAAQFFAGFGRVWENHDPNYQVFLWGRYRAGGFKEYFIVATLVKVPLGTLLLGAIGGLWFRRTGQSLSWPERLLVLMPALLTFAGASLLMKNLGIRYILPSLPLLFLLGGRTAKLSWARKQPGALVIHALVFWTVTSSILAFPDYIPYFNQIAGGSRGGARVLDDSNIDWGQDWIAVAAYQKKQDIEELRTMSINQIDPHLVYGVKGRPMGMEEIYKPETGWYAVGAHALARNTLFGPNLPVRFDWRTKYEPVRIVGATYIYRFLILEPGQQSPEDFQGVVLTRDELYHQALERLNRYLDIRPDSSDLYVLRAEVQAELQKQIEAGSDLEACRLKAREAVQAAQSALSRAPAVTKELLYANLPVFQEQARSLSLCSTVALEILAPGEAMGCLHEGLAVIDAFQNVDSRMRPDAFWTDIHTIRLQFTLGLANAHALSLAMGGNDEDRRLVHHYIDEFNRLCAQLGLRQSVNAEALINLQQNRFRKDSPAGPPP